MAATKEVKRQSIAIPEQLEDWFNSLFFKQPEEGTQEMLGVNYKYALLRTRDGSKTLWYVVKNGDTSTDNPRRPVIVATYEGRLSAENKEEILNVYGVKYGENHFEVG